MALKKIRIELARNREFPEGSPNHGYEIVLPLKADGHIDAAAFDANPLVCSAVRFWGAEEDRHGLLIRAADHGWAVSFEIGEADDEPIHHLQQHRFAEGEYISLREQDGIERTFRVAAVHDWHPGH
jgi:hypothetical protein